MIENDSFETNQNNTYEVDMSASSSSGHSFQSVDIETNGRSEVTVYETDEDEFMSASDEN